MTDGGMATGVVVTTVLPHATPAAFTSHAASRYIPIWERFCFQRTTVILLVMFNELQVRLLVTY